MANLGSPGKMVVKMACVVTNCNGEKMASDVTKTASCTKQNIAVLTPCIHK